MTRREIMKQLLALGLNEGTAKKALDVFFKTLVDSLEGQKSVYLSGFGTWEWKQAKARQARNPRTGARVHLEARKVLVFRPSQALKDKLKGLKKS
ncbi:MAG TPA: HU family DNA-binding protein [bacterium]|nr:HU family DNA-binding protein [bacterium]